MDKAEERIYRMQCLRLAVTVASFNAVEGGTNVIPVAEEYWKWLSGSEPEATDDIPF